jgi:hypothetical protein
MAVMQAAGLAESHASPKGLRQLLGHAQLTTTAICRCRRRRGKEYCPQNVGMSVLYHPSPVCLGKPNPNG